MRSVLISIQPEWCELIASGKKTVEIRKTKPKLEPPFKVYIYETKAKDHYSVFHENTIGKVVGEFVCENIENLTEHDLFEGMDEISNSRIEEFSCVHIDELLRYKGEKQKIYGWCISNLVIYDKPKDLSEFFVYCDRCDKRPIACKFAYEENNENGYYSECVCDFKRPIERPPQSWCYVDGV